MKGSGETVRLLLEKRTQLDPSDSDIQFLVLTAAKKGHGAAMQLSYDAGALLDPEN
jgi:hypothetical protein